MSKKNSFSSSLAQAIFLHSVFAVEKQAKQKSITVLLLPLTLPKYVSQLNICTSAFHVLIIFFSARFFFYRLKHCMHHDIIN